MQEVHPYQVQSPWMACGGPVPGSVSLRMQWQARKPRNQKVQKSLRTTEILS